MQWVYPARPLMRWSWPRAVLMVLALACCGLAMAQGLGASPRSGLLAQVAGGQSQARVDQVQIRLIAEPAGLEAGRRQWFGLVIDHDPGWHTYWKNPGDSGLATSASWQLVNSQGQVLASLPIRSQAWPTPSRLPVGPLANYGYEKRVVLGFELELPKSLPAGSVTLQAEAAWLVCKDVCIPGQAQLSLTLPVAAGGSPSLSADAALFDEMRRRLPKTANWGQGFAVDQASGQLLLWGQGSPEARRGLWFVEQEELTNPAAPQSWFATSDGWLVKIPLSERPKRALAAVQATGRLQAVLKPSAPPAETPDVQGYAVNFRALPLPAVELSRPVWQSPDAASESHGSAGSSTPESSGSLPVILGLAFLGGLVLNLMPCVFPVLGLKVLAYSQHAHSPAKAWQHAVLFTAGVLVSMLALAGLLLGLRAAGEAVGWGFQLQNPWVVLSLVLLFTAIGLNLLGVFEFGVSLTRLGDWDRGQGPWSAVGSGVLAVVVASPCTAPFMGTAVGYTATASGPQTLAVFGFLGLGLAFPYVLAAVWPGALARLPRPGPWMLTFKQVLAFPMLATVAWLVWVLAQQQGTAVVLPVLLALVALSFAVWCWGGLQRGPAGLGRTLRWAGLATCLGLVVWLVWSVGHDRGSGSAVSSASPSSSSSAPSKGSAVNWQPWAPGRPEQLAQQGKVVFVDFTAAWCITCQANKLRVLHNDPIAQLLQSGQVTPLVADWTRQDPAITKELQRFGRNGVPLYLVYGPGLGKPAVLGEWLSTDAVLQALRQAGLKAQ